MSETVLTSPIILDATGQDMLTKLDSIISAINPVAQGVSYDNAGTGMVANNVQSAITELKTGLVNTNSSLTHNLMSYEDVTVVTGSTQYVGYYYGDGSITTSVSDKEIVSAFVYSATSNRPAFLQRIGATSIRAFCPVSDTTIVIRVLFKHN